MEGERLSCAFKITQSRDNCRFYYKAFSKTFFVSNTPILQGNKIAHLHFLAGAAFTHLGLSLTSLDTCIMIFTAVIVSVVVGMPKWVNSYRWSSVCTIRGLLKQTIITLNVKNARESSSMTTQTKVQRTVCSTIISLVYSYCVIHLSHRITAAPGFPGGNWGQSLGWIPQALFGQEALWETAFTALLVLPQRLCNLRSSMLPPETSDWNSRPLFTKKCKYTLNFKHVNSLTDFPSASR